MNDEVHDIDEIDPSDGDDSVTDEPTRRPAKMSTLKRWIALVAAIAIGVVVLMVLGVLSFAVSESSEGADPDEAFSPTELAPESLGASVRWADDAAGLARAVEPTTREQVAAAWLRANDALVRAAEGDLVGLDVWFTGPASIDAHERFDRDAAGASITGASTVTSEVASAHELKVEFYSLDGQIMVLRANSTIVDPMRSSLDVNSTHDVRAEVIFVLSDGNWRVRNIERTFDSR